MSISQVSVEGRRTVCNWIDANMRSYANRSWQWLKKTVNPYAQVPQSLLFRIVSSSICETVGGELVKRSLRAITISPPNWVAPAARIGGISAAIGFGLNSIYFLPASKTQKIGLAILLSALALGAQEMMLQLTPDLDVVRDGLGDILGGYGALCLVGNRPDFWESRAVGYAPSMFRFLLMGHLFERVITVPTSLGTKLVFTVPRLLCRNVVQLSAFSSHRLWPFIRAILKGKVSQGPFFCGMAKVAAERYCLKTSSSLIEFSADRVNPFLEVFSEEFNRFLEENFIQPIFKHFQTAASAGAVHTVNVLSHSFIQFSQSCQSPDVKEILQQCWNAFRENDQNRIDTTVKALREKLGKIASKNKSIGESFFKHALEIITRRQLQALSIEFVKEIAKFEKKLVGIQLMQRPEKRFLAKIAPLFLHNFCVCVVSNWDKFSKADITREREKELIDCLYQLTLSSYFKLILPDTYSSVAHSLTKKVVDGFKTSQELMESFNSVPEVTVQREPGSQLEVVENYIPLSEAGDDFHQVEGEGEPEKIQYEDAEWDVDAVERCEYEGDAVDANPVEISKEQESDFEEE